MIRFNLARIEDLQLSSGDLDDTLHKLNEEAGELSGEVLAYKGSMGASIRANGTAVAVVDEACDVINSAMGIIYYMLNQEPSILSDDLVNTIFDKKLDKWESKILHPPQSDDENPEPDDLPPPFE